MDESEIEFLLRRASEELDYADACPDELAASIHRRMAVLYANRVADLNNRLALEIVPQRVVAN